MNLNILLKRFEVLYMYLFYCAYLQLKVKQNPVIPNINSGATHYIIYITSANCIYYIISCTRI